ncbi:MAG: N-acetyltransferase [Desulfobacteraceae bacterium]|nr:MAG: N-acetyltransferase [Desulfobacteraceae bacterium]
MQIKRKAKTIFRHEPCESDCHKIETLLAATGFFHSYEIDVAIELVNERLAKGTDSGYHFVLYDIDGFLAGYACYGATPCTLSSYDIYWIAVHPDFQKRGIGKNIYDETELLIQKAHGTRIYVDTSQSEKYLPTRKFYEHIGFQQAALLEDFFAPGDGKIIYCKVLP